MSSTTPVMSPLVAPDLATPLLVQEVYTAIEQELGFGMVPNYFRALATQPLVLEAGWKLFRATILKGRLPRIFKEMIGIVVSATSGNVYAQQVHLHSLGVQGIAHETLTAVASGDYTHAGLPESSRLVLELTRQIVLSGPASVTPAQLVVLEAEGIDLDALQEIYAVIGCFRFVNTMTDLLRVPVDAL